MKKKTQFPKGWNEARVKRVLDHYENQTDEEATAEDEAMFRSREETMMTVPHELVPRVRKLIAEQLRKGRDKPQKVKRVA